MLRKNLGYKVLALLLAISLWIYVIITQRGALETLAFTVPVVLRTEGQPAPGYRVARASVRPALVTVAGEGRQLRQVTQVQTVPVDVEGAQSDIHLRAVALSLPRGIISVSDARVVVDIAIEPQD
jgi:YbbR domain-containing protein